MKTPKAGAGASFLACQLPKLPCDAPPDLLIQKYSQDGYSTPSTCPITMRQSPPPLPGRPSLRTSGGWAQPGPVHLCLQFSWNAPITLLERTVLAITVKVTVIGCEKDFSGPREVSPGPSLRSDRQLEPAQLQVKSVFLPKTSFREILISTVSQVTWSPRVGNILF